MSSPFSVSNSIASVSGDLAPQDAAWFRKIMSDCILCPRACHADRLDGGVGYCGQTADIMAARASLHYWEEPCISGTSGSGTVFFSGCNLRCVFCQNHNIALGKAGRVITPEHLVKIFLQLQEQGANNINLVTPTHFLPQIVIALQQAKNQGLSIPIVYNTGSYESPEALRHLDGLVDIYLPDLKYFSPELSAAYSHAPDYFEIACAAIAEMYRQVLDPVMDPDTGLMQRGMIVRHLLLPGQAKDSKKILRYLHETYGLANRNTEKPVLHISLSPAPEDRLTDGQLVELADQYMQKMGYGNQPYIAYKHADTHNTHIHIVSVCVDEQGKKISDAYEHRRSMTACRELEVDFGLRNGADAERRNPKAELRKVDALSGPTRVRQAGNRAKCPLRNMPSSPENRYILPRHASLVPLLRETNNTPASIMSSLNKLKR